MKHTGDLKHECPVCGRKFAVKSGLDVHMKLHQVTHKAFNCSICGKQFAMAHYLKKHLEHHAPDRPYKCTICPDVGYVRRDLLTMHMLRKHSENSEEPVENRASLPRPWKCPVCQKGFTAKHNLKTHMELHNPEPSQYKCPTCGRSFARKEYLDQHMFTHTDIKPFQCNYCSQTFRRPYLLDTHIRSSHPGVIAFECDICQEGFHTLTDMKRHKKQQHKNSKDYKCTICDKSYKHKQQLKGHMETHEGKNHVCQFCAKSFGRSEYLKQHISVVHEGKKKQRKKIIVDPEAPVVKNHVCQFCAKPFARREYLKQHISVVHEGKKKGKNKINVEYEKKDVKELDNNVTSAAENHSSIEGMVSAAQKAMHGHDMIKRMSEENVGKPPPMFMVSPMTWWLPSSVENVANAEMPIFGNHPHPNP